MLEIPSAALGIAVVSALGRGVLSWLPPGAIGSHRSAELPATWAASYLLGTLAIAACAGVAVLLRVPVSCAWIAGVGVLLLFARWATLPAALVPRHEVPREIPSLAARAVFVLAIGLGVFACCAVRLDSGAGLWAVRVQAWLSQGWLIGFDGPASSRGALELSPLDVGALALVSWPAGVVSEIAARAHLIACFLATLLLTERALAVARRAPLGRRLVLVLLAVALACAVSAEDGDLVMAALCALGVLGLVSWTRRADARGLALACLAFCAIALVRPGGWALASAGLLSTITSTARPSLRRALIWASGSVVVLLVPWTAAAWLRHVPLFSSEPLSALSSSWALIERTRVALCIAPLWIVCGAAIGPAILQLARPAQHDNADRPRRDLMALCVFAAGLALCAALVVAVGNGPKLLLAKTWAPGLLIEAAPLAAALAARALLRAERGD